MLKQLRIIQCWNILIWKFKLCMEQCTYDIINLEILQQPYLHGRVHFILYTKAVKIYQPFALWVNPLIIDSRWKRSNEGRRNYQSTEMLNSLPKIKLLFTITKNVIQICIISMTVLQCTLKSNIITQSYTAIKGFCYLIKASAI